MTRSRHRTVYLSVLLILVGTIVPTAAEAGCFSQLDFCVSCAQLLLWQELPSLDADLVRAVGGMLWDCTLALYRCIVRGEHLGLRCAI